MSAVPCRWCEEPVPDGGSLCHGCTRLLGLTLRDVPALLTELEVTVTRQSRTRPGTGPIATPEVDPVRMPFNVHAAEARRDLEWAVLVWARSPHVGWGEECHVQSAGEACAWLRERLSRARANEWGADLMAQVMDAVRAARRATDAPPELVFEGPCPAPGCTAELWAPPAATVTLCRGCGSSHDLETLRTERMLEAQHVRAPAEVIANALTSRGRVLTAQRIHNWKSHGKLDAAGYDPGTGRVLYRLGDVLTVLEAMDARRAVRA